MKYSRVPGGERTEKSNVKWTYDELIKVYYLFKEIKGIGIHENNLKIQVLAKELGRGVRATEAQLLMFRNLQLGGQYSRGNMSMLCRKIWNEREAGQIEIKDKTMKKNEFIHQLLHFQQDGKQAISEPSNWKKDPLLYVETKLEQSINMAIEQIINEQSSKGVWLFLLGSPGNGKSEATAQITRQLLKKKYEFFKFKEYDDSKQKLEFSFQDHAGPIPYRLDVYDSSKKYSICSIAQDASIVKKINLEEFSPGKDLLELLISSYETGRSLIVCANRGIVEEMERIGTAEDLPNKEAIDEIIRSIISGDNSTININSSSKRKINESIDLNIESLDDRSLLLDLDDMIFERLVDKIVEEDNWSECANCDCNKVCPFYNNYLRISNKKYKDSLLRIIRHYELYSSQIIVFREALALLALIFAGNNDDYSSTSGHPCEWVNQQIHKNHYFNLFSRRVEVVLYNPQFPYGFEFSNMETVNSIPQLNEIVDQRKVLSNKYGLKRFFGEKQVAYELHPIKEGTTCIDDLYEEPNEDLIDPLLKIVIGQIKEIEEYSLENSSGNESEQVLIQRWRESIFLIQNSFNRGITRFDNELHDLVELIQRSLDPPKMGKLKSGVRNALNSLLIQNNQIKLYDNFHVKVSSLSLNIKTLEEISGSGNGLNPLGLYIFFNAESDNLNAENAVFLGAKAFCFLMRKSKDKIFEMTFPIKLLDQIKYQQVLAARKSKYHKKDSVEVAVIIDNTAHRFSREGDFIDEIN
jgi:DNA polymerase III delta prime subunit